MNKLLVAAASVLATAAVLSIPTAPVSAANDDGVGLMLRITNLDQKITAERERGALSQNDADGFGKQVDKLEKLHARYGLDGFTKIETRDLSRKISLLQAEVVRDAGGRS